MANLLLIFTEQFPYGKSEPFLQAELAFLSPRFDKIVLVPLIISAEMTRNLPKNVSVDTSFAMTRNKSPKLAKAISQMLSTTAFYREFVNRAIRIVNPRPFKRFFRASLHLGQVRYWLQSYVDSMIEDTTLLCYTYFVTGVTMGVGTIKQLVKTKLVSRGHGFDIYEDDYPGRYIPYQKKALQHLDAFFPISQHALDHLQHQYGKLPCVAEVSRLGIMPSKGMNLATNDSMLSLVTCSSLIPLKRIDLLINALALFAYQHPEIKVNWLHIGDGPLRREIEQQASAHLPPSVAWQILGHISNAAIFDLYQRHSFDLFVNLSTTEGIPVSIMEAYSCGIPALATDVNGVPEIVNNDNGVLLPVAITPSMIADVLAHYVQLPSAERIAKRQAAYAMCAANYDAEVNYARFAERLHQLI
ncbi:MAG: glycosyltransferase [Anaerolineae bacterium]|nr:glycosyltransferase [Anaerolineae bacterium]